jgi:hypothetical protein
VRLEGTDEQVMQEIVRSVLLTTGLEFHISPPPAVAEHLIAEIPKALIYQGFSRDSTEGQYTAAERERWRDEIKEAKRTMSRDQFSEWLYRRVNAVGDKG